MVNANELRIGNWVDTPNGKILLTMISDEHHKAGTFGEWEVSLSNLQPIPLTPEILEKCGFVLSYDDTFVSKKYFKKNGFNQLKDYGQQSIVLSDKGNYLECGYYENQIECNSVHQLQNLYFALTGEELTVNL